MKCETVVFDPDPSVPRGTLEYAVSALFCEERLRIEMRREEAASILQSLAGVVPQTPTIEFTSLLHAVRKFLQCDR